MLSEAGGLEKKLERITDERDRLKEEAETIKADRDIKNQDLLQINLIKHILQQEKQDILEKIVLMNQVY
jgi:hypothetical protein